jgi:hypothetical protein
LTPDPFAAYHAPLLSRLAQEMDPHLLRAVREGLIAIRVHPRPSQSLMLTTFTEQSPHYPRLKETAYMLRWGINRLLTALLPGYG